MTCEFDDGGPTMDDIHGTAVDDPPPEIETGEGDGGDACEHMWVSCPSAEFRWIQGNARARSVTRWMVHCANCGTVHFHDDPDAPQP